MFSILKNLQITLIATFRGTTGCRGRSKGTLKTNELEKNFQRRGPDTSGLHSQSKHHDPGVALRVPEAKLDVLTPKVVLLHAKCSVNTSSEHEAKASIITARFLFS